MKMQAKLLNIPTERVDDRTEGNSGGPPKDSAPRPQCTQLDCTDTWKALGLATGKQSKGEALARISTGF